MPQRVHSLIPRWLALFARFPRGDDSGFHLGGPPFAFVEAGAVHRRIARPGEYQIEGDGLSVRLPRKRDGHRRELADVLGQHRRERFRQRQAQPALEVTSRACAAER